MRAPEDSVDGPPAANVAAWDALCRRRRVVALGGLDAHDPIVRVGRRRLLRPMPNHRYFRLLTTHVLLDQEVGKDAAADLGAVLRALAEGRCYLAVEARGNPKGFAFWAEGGAGAVPMGGEAAAGEWTLQVRLPSIAELRLVRDGAVVEVVSSARAATWPVTGAGVFRVEAHVDAGARRRPWVLSNPIYLRA
jgi:hypothetical protein